MKSCVVSFVLILLGSISPTPCFAESSDPSKIEMTIRRYFLGQTGYHEGDLITRSQVEQLQGYLRKTRRRTPAAHPIILQRFLPDKNRLCKAFYLKNGGETLRETSMRVGGYAALEALARDTSKYKQLINLLDSDSVDSVVELVESVRAGKTTEEVEAEKSRKQRKKTIYTVEEFIQVISEASKEKTPVEGR